MTYAIGIRREDKSKWERRVPLTPEHVKELIENNGIEVYLQPSSIRIFSDQEFIQAGAKIQEDLSSCPVIFAVKEIPVDFFRPGGTYVFFSHVIKGQKHNMPMLKKMMELKCNLIDYEKVADDEGRRLIFFGRHAGLAGMIDTLWGLGRRLEWEEIGTPFSEVKNAYRYESLAKAKESISEVGELIRKSGLPEMLTPLIFGVTGYGNVSNGAQEILDLLPFEQIDPEEIFSLVERSAFSRNQIYKVVFKEEHIVEPIAREDQFDLQDYYNHPQKYRSQFERHIPHLTVLVNCIYWDERYPRLVTKKFLKELFDREKNPRLRVIGDISCDVEGSIECTAKVTQPDNPVYVYNPIEEGVTDGHEGEGVVILAVDNLPCEISREASLDFSQALKPFVLQVAKADLSVSFDECKLPGPIKKGMILYHGELTPDYRYIQDFL
ncbi:MAG: bifunctional lysine ketoglutarate reductase /saccharopine dehydrogenase family protein [Candidatus Zixiibacteriota bacterium]